VSLPEAKAPLLIVEDDAAALRQLRWTFDEYEVATARDRPEALEQLRTIVFPVVLLDLGLPPEPEGASEGLAALREILIRSPDTKVIVVTGRDDREHALRAVELGAYDFYRKPADADEIRFLVQRARQLHDLEQENRRLARRTPREPLPGIVATSDAMLRACRMVELAASSDITVTLVGESGTGKEVLARALHALSSRASGPLTAINCAAIPEQLLESELFGHERGAFTGANRQSIGRFELANGGLLFLDEVGDIPLPLQVKLLRVLEERVIQRVGGRTDIPLDIRIACATHRDLPALVTEGGFREDLYYRISELVIEIPPLRERPQDALLLAQHFLGRLAENDRALRGLRPDALAAIAHHTWPGNVRELENRMKRAALMAEGSRISAADLDLSGVEPGEAPPPTLKDSLREAERQAVERAWGEADGNVSRVAKALGVSRPTMYKLLREHGLKL
jgi:two-component system NtrC family response regulator